MVNQSKASSPIFRNRWLNAGALASSAGRVKAPVKSLPIPTDEPVSSAVLLQRLLAHEKSPAAAQKIVGYYDQLVLGGSFKIEWNDHFDQQRARSASGRVEYISINLAWPVVSLHSQQFGIYLEDITSLAPIQRPAASLQKSASDFEVEDGAQQGTAHGFPVVPAPAATSTIETIRHNLEERINPRRGTPGGPARG